MHEPAAVAEGHVGAGEDVVGDGLAEDFDAEGVGDAIRGVWSVRGWMAVGGWVGIGKRRGGGLHLFRFSLEVGVDEGDVVVAADYVAEGG